MAVREVSGNHPREKIMKTDNKNDKKVYLVAQELKLVRVLAGNNKTSRDRALKSLKKWFSHRSKTLPFTDNDFQIIWKGLYYSMWMSDKPLIQEECAENIANLIHFETFDESLLFFKAGLTILINEWFGIDQLRLDKFLMLVRRLLRQMLVALKKHGLSKKNIDKFTEVLSYTILNTEIRPPVGLFMHFTEIYLEELAKVTEGNMPSERLVDFVVPFIKKLVVTRDGREIAQIKKFIFIHLIKQSKLGIEYQIKYEAWKKEGFPGSIDSMQKVKVNNEKTAQSDDEDSKEKTADKPLDPRAGRVDVELPQLKFRPQHITDALLESRFDKNGNSKSRTSINELYNYFAKMSKGVYPLGTKRVLNEEKDAYDTNIRKAANRLIKFENKLLGKGKKKKRAIENEEEEEVEVPRKVRKVQEKQGGSKNGNEEGQQNGDGETLDDFGKFVKSRGGAEKTIKVRKTPEKRSESNKTVDVKVEGGIGEKKAKRKRKAEASSDKTETKKKKRNTKPSEEIINNIECVFERNSGTWVVYDTSREKDKAGVPSKKTEIDKKCLTVIPLKEKESPSTSSSNGENSEFVVSFLKKRTTIGIDLGISSGGRVTPSKKSDVEEASPESAHSPVRLFESPPETKDLFPRSPWDEPLQEGEYEICIPSKKHVARLKRQARKSNESVHELIHTSMKQIRGKGRLSLDAGTVKNPFSTPISGKKVKINTKLNQSQEIHEHVQQILSSPGIPYDASKKPLKPLLKASATSTPLNPFYSKQLNVW